MPVRERTLTGREWRLPAKLEILPQSENSKKSIVSVAAM
jgi:hypothetical protein